MRSTGPPLLIVALPDNEPLGREIADRVSGEFATPALRRFPVPARVVHAASLLAELRRAGLTAPVCVGVHAIFAGDAYAALRSAGAQRIVTTDTIRHESNAIGVGGALAAALGELAG